MNRRSYVGVLNPNFGKKHSKESILKMSENRKGKGLRRFPAELMKKIPIFYNDEKIIGMMLSDGFLTKNELQHSYIRLEQCEKNKELVEDFGSYLKQLGVGCKICSRERRRFKNVEGKMFQSTYVYSESNCIFSYLRNKWYVNNVKIVPTDIGITAKTLAYWFMGDGSSTIMKRQQHEWVIITLATNSFDIKSVQFLIQKLNNLGIEGIKISVRNEIKIQRQEQVKRFFDIIEPYMLDTFRYKIKRRKCQ